MVPTEATMTCPKCSQTLLQTLYKSRGGARKQESVSGTFFACPALGKVLVMDDHNHVPQRSTLHVFLWNSSQHIDTGIGLFALANKTSIDVMQAEPQ